MLGEYKVKYATQIAENLSFLDVYININEEKAKQIESMTRLQSKSSLWRKERLFRITASNFKNFSSLRDTTDPVNVYQQLQRIPETAAMRHGKMYEDMAIKHFLETQTLFSPDFKGGHLGLVVHPSFPFLGASPDYFVMDDGIKYLLEI